MVETDQVIDQITQSGQQEIEKDFGEINQLLDQVNQQDRVNDKEVKAQSLIRSLSIEPVTFTELDFKFAKFNDEGDIVDFSNPVRIDGTFKFNVINESLLPFARLDFTDTRLWWAIKGLEFNLLPSSSGSIGVLRGGQKKTISIDFQLSNRDWNVSPFVFVLLWAIWARESPLTLSESGGDFEFRSNMSWITGSQTLHPERGEFTIKDIEFIKSEDS